MEMQNSIWKASTNWNITEGSLHESISYDTSADAENLSEAEPLLLTTPDVGGDSPPCEVTIYFKEKHEIHRIYVRSTARVFEIYISYNQQDNSEYLCTVKCGAVIEVVPETSNETASIPEQLVRNASSLSVEDGWVKVKDLNSQEHSTLKECDGEINCLQNQVHYEATAEISNVDPCLTLTVRLLSIQTKDRVHINEIYVYADPVESHDTDPSANTIQNSGTSALFATLLPSLMQLSKSSTNQNTRASEETSVRKQLYSEEKTAQAKNPTNEKSLIHEALTSSTPVKNSSPVQEQTEIKYYVDQNTGHVYTRIEKVLNELIVKVDRVESFCSSFEEKLLKPLDSMEKKIQQLEQKLDSLTKENKSSNQCFCSTSASSKSSECDPEDEGDPTFENIEPKEYADDAACSMIKSESRPGLIIKAPEFVVEEDDSSDNEDALNSFTEESHKEVAIEEETMQKKKSVSIDSALASSLAALLSSANDTSIASHEAVNDTNSGSLDNITYHNSASEDGFHDHTEELVISTTTEICNKSDSTAECPKNDYLFSVASADVPSSVLTSEEGSDIIVMLPKTSTLCKFSNKEDDVLENKKEKDNAAKTCPAGSDKFNMWNEFIGTSSLDLNQNSTLASDNKSQVIDVSLENELCDVKFTQDKNWVSGLPLEVLLTDVSDSKLLEASTSRGDGNYIADEDQGSETGSDMYGSWVS